MGGSRQFNEIEVTRDSEEKVVVGQLTGRGNRRLEGDRGCHLQREEVQLYVGHTGDPICLATELI